MAELGTTQLKSASFRQNECKNEVKERNNLREHNRNSQNSFVSTLLTDAVDVELRHLKMVKSILARHLPYKQVWAYGSRVKWTASETSDLDCTVFEATDSEIADAQEAFDQSDIPFEIQLLSWETILDDFKEHIKEQYFILQSKRDWREFKLGEVGEIITGTTPSKHSPEDWGEHIPFVTPTDYSNYRKSAYATTRSLSLLGKNRLSNRVLPVNSIMVTCIGSDMGKVAMNSIPVITNQQINSIIPNIKLCDNNFMYYRLISIYHILRGYGMAGTAVPIVNKHDFSNIITSFPPLSEQKAIASVLASLDDKIDLLHKQNKTLEAVAETLFRQWFIEEAQDDWEEGIIPDEFDFTMGLSPPSSSYNENAIGMPMFQGNADFTFRFPNNRIYTNDAKKLAEPYDTLVSVRAPVGAQNMAKEKCCIGRGVAAFRYKKYNEFSTYTYYKMKSLMDEIKQFNETGTVFGSIGKNDFLFFKITIPPASLVEKFQSEVKPIDKKIKHNQNQIKTLESIRGTLLPKLMSGDVRVEYEEII